MKSYKDVIQLLIEANDKLYEGKMPIEMAKQICQNTQTIINAAKLHLDVCKYHKKIDNDFFGDNNPLSLPVLQDMSKLKHRDISPKDGGKSCDMCAHYSSCLQDPRCAIDHYENFKKI